MTELEHARNVLAQARDRVRDAYGEAIGRHRDEVTTPALLLDLAAARRNIATMAQRMESMSAALRPHIKVHKSPELARLQADAGAIGISAATVWEAIVMGAAGLEGLFVVNTVATPRKVSALAMLAREADVSVAVDDAANAAQLAAAARVAGSTLGVLIEVDTGMDRAGVDTLEEAVSLARAISRLDGIQLRGVTGYEGHCSLTPERELRHRRQQTAMGFLVEAAGAISSADLPCDIVSAGGTATWDWTATYPGVTEIQAGSYVLMDRFHGAMVSDFEYPLTVLTTVISRRPERVVFDAGNKSMGAPAVAAIKGHDLRVDRFDEEHGIFVAGPGDGLDIGDVVELLPGYSPATVNWYDAYHVLEDERVVDIWPIIPRGPGHGGLLR